MNNSQLEIKDYYPAPFWFLNHKLEKSELLRQLKLMKDQGISAFFLHPRAGLKTPYGSREFFELIRFTAVEADKLGMKAWLYDEDPFPSGPAGGRIFLEHPEFAARSLNFHELSPDADGHLSADLGEGKLLEAIAVRCDDAGNVLEQYDVFDDAGMIRSDFFRSDWHNSYYHHLAGRVFYDHYRAETFYPHLQLDIELEKDWKIFAVTADTVHTDSKYRVIPDNLNPDCVKEFMRWTHELYEKYMGDLFGTVIPGIFTDETATGGSFSWTPRLADEFKKRRDMDITGRYHEIFRGNSRSARELREAYWKTVHELFIESFFEPVNEWCKKHHMALCGHGIGEEQPLATTNGMNIFNIQKYTGIPGFDHITPNIPNWSDFTSLNLGGKLVASAAEQMGQHRVMTECFACNPYNFGHDGMKKNLSWLYSLGINWAVPHAFHYSYDGFRKDDAGKSFFFQSPDYPEFHKFGNFAAELGWRLGESRSTAEICVLYPESVFRSLIPAEHDTALQKSEALYRCNQFLLQNQIQFEFADETTLRNARITEEGFFCGKKFYKHLILPFGIDREYLDRFAGFIISPEDALALRKFAVRNANTGEYADTVMTQFRDLPENAGKLLYFFHNSDRKAKFTVQISAPGLYGYFIIPGENRIYKFKNDDVIALPPYGSALLEFRTGEIPGTAPYTMNEPSTPDFSFMTTPQWDYLPPLDNLIALLRDWDYGAGDETVTARRADVMKYIFGSEFPHQKTVLPKAIFDRSPSRKRFYPAAVTARSSFVLPGTNKKYALLFESETFAGQCRLCLNGQLLPPPERQTVYDAWNMVIDISPYANSGTNILQASWDSAGEDDGITSMVYVIEKE
ncbi:MAG: hypothetical protein IKA71_08245 [Lentisphaeria bacterium]|nr:hypothetical protein [Lentisphaeria bacterium]